jgi:hypothetical protein
MNTELLVALCSLAGSCIGTLGGINLINWRLKQLEKRVDKHNNVVERQYKIEENQAILTEQIKVANHRIKDLEEKRYDDEHRR